jgi:hypothetical protein
MPWRVTICRGGTLTDADQQRAQLPGQIWELVLDDQRLRNDKCWSVFDC